VDRWLPCFRQAGQPADLASLVRRYLRAYGPATAEHFARWLGAPRPWATDLFGSLASQLTAVDLDGRTAWLVAGDEVPPAHAPAGLRLLPYFDAYVVGGQPRELLFPGRAAERALAHGQAGNYPVLLIGGTVAGVWHHRLAGRSVRITVEPLNELTTDQRAELQVQAERVGSVLQASPRLVIDTVTTGPHA
jgi:hypothetical protein